MKKKALYLGLLLSTTTLSGCLPAALIAAAGSGAYVAHNRKSPQIIYKDFKLFNEAQDKILEAYPELKSPMRSGAFTITSYNGAILLTGQVPSDAIRRGVQSVATQLHARVIYNQLTVGPYESDDQLATDAWLTTKVKSRMIGDVDPTRIKVVTQNSIVYLMGIVTHAEAHSASQVARETDGVKQVITAFDYITEPTQASVSSEPKSTSSSKASSNPEDINH